MIGRFTEATGFNDGDPLFDMLERLIGPYEYLVITDVDFGHSDPQMTMPVGRHCLLRNVDIFFYRAVA